MKKIALIVIALCPILCKAQINLLKYPQDSISVILAKNYSVSFNCIKYDVKGEKMLFFDFPTNNPYNLTLSAFYMGDDGKCYRCIYSYSNDSNMDLLVNSIKTTKGWEKIPDKFEFVNYDIGCSVMFVREDSSDGFSIAFNLIKKQ